MVMENRQDDGSERIRVKQLERENKDLPWANPISDAIKARRRSGSNGTAQSQATGKAI
jgi:hypothetical protein